MELNIIFKTTIERFMPFRCMIGNHEKTIIVVFAVGKTYRLVVSIHIICDGWTQVSLLEVVQMIISVEPSLIVSSLERPYYKLSSSLEWAQF